MRPTPRSASPPKPLPERQATARPWTERIDIICRFLRVFGAVSSVRGVEQGKGSPTLEQPNPTSAFPLVGSFATKLRTKLVSGEGWPMTWRGTLGGHSPSWRKCRRFGGHTRHLG